MKKHRSICSALLALLLLTSCQQKEGVTPLMLAARSGDSQKLERHLAEGMNVNAQSKYGWTALMFASWKGHKNVVIRLMDAGADPNLVSQTIAKNTQGPIPKTTALAEAVGNNHFSIANTLMARGANIDPMSVALAGGLEDLSLLKKMHAKGADLTKRARVYNLSTALNRACSKGRLENVEWLIKQGIEPDSAALQIAVKQDYMDILQFLLAHDVEQNRFSERDFSTALWRAATKQNTTEAEFTTNLKIIKLLLAHNADRNYRPESGYGAGKTAVEFLNEKRGHALERIELNPYGAKQQAYERKWLHHRDAIISLLAE